jgi:hypothetical protein
VFVNRYDSSRAAWATGRCTIAINRAVKRTPTGWCRALRPVFGRLAAGRPRSGVPYECRTVVGPLPRRPRLAIPVGIEASEARRAYRVARAHWPRSACRGREQVRLVPEDAVLALTGNLPEVGRLSMGAAKLGDRRCVVSINDDTAGYLTPMLLCLLAAHEFGHLAGHEHDKEMGKVMSAQGAWSSRCGAAFSEPAPGTASPATPAGFGGF